MIEDNLDQLSDAELNEVFAVEVAGIPRLFTLMKRGYYYRPNANGYTASIQEAWRITEDVADKHVYPYDEPVTKHRLPHDNYSTDANTMVLWLGKYRKETDEKHSGEGTTFRIYAPASDEDMWTVCPVWMHHDGFIEELGSSAPTFARAACIALIRAKRTEAKRHEL